MNNTYFCGTIYGAINCLKPCVDITNCNYPEMFCFYSPDYCRLINNSSSINGNIIFNLCRILLTAYFYF